MADIPRVYWDACAWLGLINYEKSKRAPLEHFFDLAQRGQCELWTSTICFVEVFQLRIEQGMPKPFDAGNLDAIRDVMEQPFVKLVPVDLIIARKARELRRTVTASGTGAADCVHLATALMWNVTPLHTWDRPHLLTISNTLQCKDGTPLEICVPEIPQPGPLFNQQS